MSTATDAKTVTYNYHRKLKAMVVIPSMVTSYAVHVILNELELWQLKIERLDAISWPLELSQSRLSHKGKELQTETILIQRIWSKCLKKKRAQTKCEKNIIPQNLHMLKLL